MSAAALVQLAGRSPRSAHHDVQVSRVRALGTTAWMAFRLDRREAARRQAVGLGPVLAWDLLDTLMELPAGLPVPAAALTGPARRRVSGAAAGVARVSAGAITREVVPAVTPLLAVVLARDWDTGMARASRFATYCRRMVAGSGIPGDDQLATATRAGIGIAVRPWPGAAAEVVLEPEPVLDWQPTTAWWRLCELVYDQAGASVG
jgi:hypothetical protein